MRQWCNYSIACWPDDPIAPACCYDPAVQVEESGLQECADVDSRFAEDGAESSFGHIAVMMRNCDFAACQSMTPDLMAARPGAVKSKTEFAQPPRRFAVLESG
jgi:hypothetical protein